MSDSRTTSDTELPSTTDVVIIGGGHNALVAAAYLLHAGRDVVVLERMPRLGGWVHTTDAGPDDFRHDPYGAVHSGLVGGPVWAELGDDLARHGLSYANGPVAGGASLGDGRSIVYPVDPERWASELERVGDRDAWERLFGAATWIPDFFALLSGGLDDPEPRARLARLIADGAQDELPFVTLLAGDALTLAAERFASEELRFLATPWPLHFGVGPEDAAGALWAMVSLASLAGGCPLPVGGSGRLIDALRGLCEERGAVLRTATEVDEITISEGRSSGVRTADGITIRAREAVIASVTPDALYERLLRRASGVPAAVRSQARRFRPARGCLQINLALSARPRFTDPRLDAGGAINLGRGTQALGEMVRQADAGLLPEHPVLSWCEPTAVDPSRAPTGCATARIQVIGVPYAPSGDAGGSRWGANGWDRPCTEAFADRVLAEAERHLPGLGSLVTDRFITTPADLAAANPNAGPGDHAGGLNALEQTLVARPIPAHRGGYRTAIPGVWMTGAATWPGGGITGVSGRAAAQAVLSAATR